MSKYPINITSEINLEQLHKGLFIFIFRASKIPPHIGIIAGGKLYDITSVGPNLGLPASDFYKTIIKRNTEVIFIELKKTEEDQYLTSLIETKVREYWKVTENTSCLNPVKDFIADLYKTDLTDANFVFELLPILFEKGIIANTSQVNIPESKMVNNVFNLTKYTQKDIENCIAALQRKEKVTC